MQKFTPEEIIDKLEEAFTEQGLKVKLVSVEAHNIKVHMERFAPGLPAAFMVQAIEGTFKRYCPEITEVILDNYQGLKEHRGPGFSFKGLPGVDLTKAPLGKGSCALENFFVMMKHLDYQKFLIKGLNPQDQDFFDTFCKEHLLFCHPLKDDKDSVLVVHRYKPCQEGDNCSKDEKPEYVPSEILLLENNQK